MVPSTLKCLLLFMVLILCKSAQAYTGPAIGLHKFTTVAYRSSNAPNSITVVPAIDSTLTNAPIMTESTGKRQRMKSALRRVRRKVSGFLSFNRNQIRVEKNFPVKGRKYERARRQPLAAETEHELAMKYAAIESVEERAYQIVLDLGLVRPAA